MSAVILVASRAAMPVVGGGVAPSVTSDPTLASDGTPQVGESISQGTGSASGSPSPTPTMTLEVSANGSSGWSTQTATGAWQSGDLGKYFRTKVVWMNSAGSATGYSSVVGPVAEASEQAPLQLYGDATLPAAIELKAASNVTSQPFTVGLPLARGVLPSGRYLTLATASALSQVVKTTWDDGSAKMVVLSGKLTNTGSAYTSCAIGSTDTAPGGSALTESDLVSAGHTLSVAVGAIGTVTLASLIGQTANSGNGFTGRLRTWLSTANCSEWHYTAPVGSDAHLRVHIYARLYSGGKAWFLVAVDNSTLRVAGIGSKTYIPTVTINGSTVYNNGGSSLTQRARQAWAMEFWSDGFGGWTPKHDTANLMATRLVPNYDAPAPSSLYSDAKMTAAQTNTPLAVNALPTVQSWWPGGLSGGGASPHIGILSLWDAAYLTSGGDSRAYKSVVNTSYAAACYVRLMDESTCEPVRMTQAGNGDLSAGHYYHWADGSDPIVVESGDLPWQHELAHMPSMGYLAYLLTGNHWHLETCINAATTVHMGAPVTQRGQTDGVIYAHMEDGHPIQETRAVAWAIRSYAQAAAIAPDGSSAAADFNAVLSNTLEDLYNVVVSGTRLSGAWANNPLGITPMYGSFSSGGYIGSDTSYWDSTFTHHFMMMSIGHTKQIAPLSNAAHVDAVLTHTSKFPVGMSSLSSGFNWRRGVGAYEWPVFTAKGGGSDFVPPLTFHTFASSHSKYIGYHNNTGFPRGDNTADLGSLASTAGATIKETASNADATYSGLANNVDGYVSNMLASLAHAVDHGAVGAAQAWANVVGASNFAAIGSGRGETPQYQIAPRSGFSPARTGLPTWANSVSPMTWHRIPNTKLSDLDTALGIVQNPNDVTGPSAKITAWNGVSYSRERGAYIIAAQGGHGDYSGNEVQIIRLGEDSPQWEMVKAPTPETLIKSGIVFDDGRRAATHSYLGTQYIPQLDRTFLMQCYGVDNTSNYPVSTLYPKNTGDGLGWRYIMAFNHGTGDWDPPDRWAMWPDTSYASWYGCFAVTDITTGECWAAPTSGQLRKFDFTTNSWSSVLVNTGTIAYRAGAMDHTRKKVLLVGADSNGIGPAVLNLSTNDYDSVTFGGLGAAALTFAGTFATAGVVYDDLNDCYWVFPSGSGNASGDASGILKVDASTWAVSAPSISGTSPGTRMNGWMNSVQYDPALKGLVCCHEYDGNMFYLRTSA